MSSAVETSLLSNSKRFLDVAQNDRLEREINPAFTVAALYERRSLCFPARLVRWSQTAATDQLASQFDRALEDKLGRSGECDICESLTVAAKTNI